MIKFVIVACLPLILIYVAHFLGNLVLYPIYRFAGGRKSLTKFMKNI